MSTRSYHFHGLALVVASDDAAVAEAIDGRLRQFSASTNGAPRLSYRLRLVASGAEHSVRRPDGASRTVYDAPVGEVSYFAADDLLYIDYADRVRVLCDPERSSIFVSARDSEREQLWLLSRPLFTLPLIELLKRRGLYSVHAAGTVVDGHALLLAGGSGAGKSTLAIALVRAGFGFLGDDMLFLRRDGDNVRVCSFPDEIDVADSTARWFPELGHLTEQVRSSDWPKHRIRAEETFNVGSIAGCAPGAIVFPRVSAAEHSVLTPMSRDEALLELAPNVLLTEPRASQAHLDAVGELVRASECYRLETARDFDRLPRLLADLL